MGSTRQKNRQMMLAFMEEGGSETPRASDGGAEQPVSTRGHGNPAVNETLMEEVCERNNLRKALKAVRSNKGSAGVDGMTVDKLGPYLAKHWLAIRAQLMSGNYRPQAVKRVEIPKPDGGVRKLGIPTVLDRFIQQAVLQVLQSQWDATFSRHSFGFRPKRSAHQAVALAQEYIRQGRGWVVDLDLEKFFDKVNHDKLMGQIGKRVKDERVLKLIRAFLNAGVMEDGLVKPTDEGTPQGGPLSPLLSNLVLDELDRKLEQRGHCFVRYADDCNIYVRSKQAGGRVMKSVTRFITEKLKLKVNESKSAVARPAERKFLGFSFTRGKEPKRRIAPKALDRFKKRVRELTRRRRETFTQMIAKLAVYLRGWQGYYGNCQTPSVLEGLNGWIRRRMRSVIWRAWKRGKKRFAELRKRGIGKDLAAQTAGSSHGPWRISATPTLNTAFPDAFFERAGLLKLTVRQTA
jgi:RNA-directed DNA polymerase